MRSFLVFFAVLLAAVLCFAADYEPTPGMHYDAEQDGSEPPVILDVFAWPDGQHLTINGFVWTKHAYVDAPGCYYTCDAEAPDNAPGVWRFNSDISEGVYEPWPGASPPVPPAAIGFTVTPKP